MLHGPRRALAAGTLLLATAGGLIGTAPALAATAHSSVDVALVGPPVRAKTSATFKITNPLTKATVSCRLDSGAWNSCGASKTVNGLGNGRHTLAVKVTKGRTTRTGSASVTVDTQAPKTPGIANQSGGWTNASSVAAIATKVSDVGLAGGVTYQSRTAGMAGKNCGTYSAAHTIAARAADITTIGITCVEFRAVDAVGNASGWSAHYTVLIDRTAPSKAAITGADANWHRSVMLTVSANDATSGIDHYQWYTSADGPWTPLAINWGKPTMTLSTTGTYQVKAVAFDSAGNQAADSAIVTVKVDRTAPTTPVLPAPTTDWYTNDPNIVPAGSTDADSGVDHYTCYNDTKLLGNTDTSGNLALRDGAYYAVFCKAVDTAGNVSSASNTEVIMIDTVGPTFGQVQVETSPDGSVTVFSPDVIDTRSGASDVLEYQYSDNGGASWADDWETIPYGAGLGGWPTGSYQVHFRAFDAAGNSAVSDVVSFTVNVG